ncbi:hypothetical protein AB205_0172670 [Aquarana catesbeiana]|uniref:Uncharacterized protein n=1 Tax=Aquarana catesbeiana TaxID=8400 RepID=A0A2G9RC14_AQUCT|nr:hypothetical protein AB205_0172670 [Aquarana catesbeiana]
MSTKKDPTKTSKKVPKIPPPVVPPHCHPLLKYQLWQARVLEQIGCIKKCYMEKCFKATLCSQCKIPQVSNTSRLSENVIVFYEPTIDCTLRLGGIFPSEDNWNKWVL